MRRLESGTEESMSNDVKTTRVRDKILKTANKYFAEKGINRTTYAQISEGSGVGVSEIKKQFKDKNSIALAAQAHELEKLTKSYLTNMPDATPDATIKYILQARLEFVNNNQERTLLFFQEAFMGKEPWSSMLDDLIWKLSIEFSSIMGKGVRDGYIKKGIDINTAVRSLVSYYLTGLVVIGLRAKVFSSDAVWEFIEPQIDLLFDELKA